MSATPKCRGCGTEVPVNAPLGHCPNCLLELGFGPPPKDVVEPSAAAPAAGRTLGDYELIEQIGRGGMGVIYKARQISLNRLVALKTVNSGEFASPTMVQRFHIEAEAAANLHHPNIVPIYETGEVQGQHFFSMELIDGTSLDRHFTRGGFCLGPGVGEGRAAQRARQEQIARILMKIARAVDYAHQHGVLHRDIKPSNILLDRQGEPHLTDFGVAKVIGHTGSDLTASGAIIGTPSYMAPEQAAGNTKRVTTSADVYSLGAVLYGMLTGHPPFRADTPVQTLKQVVEQEPRHPSTLNEGVDRDLANICLKCMEKDPARRYSSAAAMAEELDRWLRGEPIQARATGAGERFWRWCRRNPKVAALGATVALLLVLLSTGSTIAALVFAAQRDVIRRTVTQELIDVSEGRRASCEVPSAMRRALTSGIFDTAFQAVFGRKSTETFGIAMEIKYVEHVYEHPTNMLTTLSPILSALEDDLSLRLRKPVVIHMHVVGTPTANYEAMGSDALAFGRMGPASSASLAASSNGSRLLAMQDHKKPLTVAIFTRKDGAVARFADSSPNAPLSLLLSNRSLALTHTNSTTGNYMAKWFLASSGVFAPTAAGWVKPGATMLVGYSYLGSQRKAIDAVVDGRFDVGAGNVELVDKYPELRVLAKLEAPDLGRCWVGGRGLPPDVFTNLQQSLLHLDDLDILSNLESEVEGFKVLDQPAFDRLGKLIQGASAFDAGTNSPAP